MYELNVDQWYRDYVMIINDVGFSCARRKMFYFVLAVRTDRLFVKPIRVEVSTCSQHEPPHPKILFAIKLFPLCGQKLIVVLRTYQLLLCCLAFFLLCLLITNNSILLESLVV